MSGDRAHRRQVIALDTWADVAEPSRSVEVSVDRYDAIETIRDEKADHLLAYAFAGMKGDVLPHVAKVRGDESEPLTAISPQRLRGKQKGKKLVIRPVERGINNPHGRSRPRANAQLAIRKCVDVELMQWQPQTSCQTAGVVHISRQAMDGDTVHGFNRCSCEVYRRPGSRTPIWPRQPRADIPTVRAHECDRSARRARRGRRFS